MKTLLHDRHSLFGDHGQSAVLAADFVCRWHARHPGARVNVREQIASAGNEAA
jgi:FMN-dependent NADH-azoreductase